MLNIQTVPQPILPASQIGTDQLLRNLGRFPAPVLPIGVLCELQSRGDAIHDSLVDVDALINRLKKRADKRDDLQSALVVCELMDLSAQDVEVADAAVRASFGRGQIDEGYVGIRSWDDTTSRGRFDDNESTWTDPAAELSKWCYDFVSDDLDPVDSKLRVNELGNRTSHLTESSVPFLIDQLRQSNDERFPRDAVRSIEIVFADAYHTTIDLIREEVLRYQRDSDSWSGNGAYLGLVLTIADKLPLPVDLLQTILRLPQTDREAIFGDQFGLIVQAITLAPLRQHGFIEQWIWDADRSNADRREMVNLYVHACHNNQLDREVAIEALVVGLQRSLLEEPMLIAPYAENLAFFTPRKHRHVLDEAFRRTDVIWFVPLEDLRRMADDAEFAKAQVLERSRAYFSVRNMINDGTMFPSDAFQERPKFVPPPQAYSPPQALSEMIIRRDDRTPRNAMCPCGSGKKYKKCCLAKSQA